MRRTAATVNLFRRASTTSSGTGGSVHKLITFCHLQSHPTKRGILPDTASPVRQSLSALSQWRSFSSSAGSENISFIKSEEEFASAMKKVKEDTVPALFYFTAAWCGPCRVISPAVEELSKKYPHVKTYKIDIDEESIRNKLSEMKIMAVPTIQFFHDGKKVDEVVGADINRVKANMERLYK